MRLAVEVHKMFFQAICRIASVNFRKGTDRLPMFHHGSVQENNMHQQTQTMSVRSPVKSIFWSEMDLVWHKTGGRQEKLLVLQL